MPKLRRHVPEPAVGLENVTEVSEVLQVFQLHFQVSFSTNE